MSSFGSIKISNFDLLKVLGKSSKSIIIPKGGLMVIYHGTTKKYTLNTSKQNIYVQLQLYRIMTNLHFRKLTPALPGVNVMQNLPG